MSLMIDVTVPIILKRLITVRFFPVYVGFYSSTDGNLSKKRRTTKIHQKEMIVAKLLYILVQLICALYGSRLQ